MKKIMTTLCLGVLTAFAADAQAVLGYTLAESQGTYTPLTDPTVIFEGTTTLSSDLEKTVLTPDGPVDEAGSAKGFSLGFETQIAGTTYTDFLVSAAGYIYLGNGDIEHNPNMRSNFMTYAEGFTTVGFSLNKGVNYNENTRISYQTLGSGDDARLVVQFENFGLMYRYWGDPVYVDIQMSIDKSGKVQYVFNNFSNVTEEGVYFSLWMGVCQGDHYVCAAGELGSLGVKRDFRDNADFYGTTPDGTTITWNVPTQCVVPEAQPSDLELTATSDEVNGSFSPVPSADTYLVTYTVGDVTPGQPQDGVVYAEGDMLGDAKVAYFGDETSFIVRNVPGGTSYKYWVYAVKTYGIGGPVYNTVSPLSGTVATLPAPVQNVEVSAASLTSVSLDVTGNEADDEIVVVYNSYCERDVYGDHGLFGRLDADVKAGDVLPVPDDYVVEGEGAKMPENAGTVAYVGKADGTITIDGLQSGTGYYIAVYTRSGDKYTSKPFNTGAATYIENPYDGNSSDFIRYDLPFGWTGSENDGNTVGFRNEEFLDYSTLTARQGTQVIQQRAYLNRGNATDGKEAWLTPSPVVVNDRHVMAKFDYCITSSVSRFATEAYNEWAEGDMLEIRVSEDNGETWKALTSYNDAEHPVQDETLSYVSIAADLNDYRGKTVLVQLYWKTFTAPSFGANMYIDRFSVTQAEFPAVPEVTVAKVTDSTAVVSWVSKQTDYELVYGEKDGNISHTVQVKGTSSYTLEGLEANTEYEVKVRGILADEESGEQTGYSEWSDMVAFTTADYPEVEAPQNLRSDVETLASLGYVVLAWDKVVEADSYEVAYRLSSSTEWVYGKTTETSMMLTDLENGAGYVWKVRAFCTHDRETAYSAQARFTAPEVVGVDGIEVDGVSVSGGAGFIGVTGAEGLDLGIYSVNGTMVVSGAACDRYELAPGLYVVAVAGKTFKVIVR